MKVQDLLDRINKDPMAFLKNLNSHRRISYQGVIIIRNHIKGGAEVYLDGTSIHIVLNKENRVWKIE